VIDLSAIPGVLTSLKALNDLLNLGIGGHDARVVAEQKGKALAEVARALELAVKAYETQTEMLQRVGELEEEVNRLKTWHRERTRYQLKEVAPLVFAYALKEAKRRGEPMHWICAGCYQQGQKSILQGTNSAMSGWTHSCPSCGAQIATGFADE